ncbi:MAG: trans-aconitate 2-methyltransferase [Pseudomonadota bacterium]|nr:trans-aconitate 2-methyltransferase [Pseudomonadota bacterium]
MNWSARQYAAFEDERTRPVRDLLGALPVIQARSVIDLGCGPGNSTEVLAARYPQAQIAGIDSSPDMIAAARKRLPHIKFRVEEVQSWRDPGPFDVILANAVLHWLHDHESLMPRLLECLEPGGALAIQMPDNLDEPAHRLMRQIAQDGPWAAKLADASAARTPLASAEWYYELLKPRCARVDIWLTTYYHVLPGGAAIAEWFKGSGLRPFLDPLSDDERAAYLRDFKHGMEKTYPSRVDGSVLLPFPRLFMVAIR